MSHCNIATLALAAGRTTQLRDAGGTRIECVSGSLWITQHHDSRDIVLVPGEAFTLDRRGTALVHAFQRSLVLVARAGAAPAGRWWTRAGRALLCYFVRLGMSRTAWRRAYRL